MKQNKMKQQKQTTALLATLGLITFSGCAPTATSVEKTGNTVGGLPAGKVNMGITGSGITAPTAARLFDHFAPSYRSSALTAAESNSTIAVKDSLGTQIGTLTLTDARLSLKEIKLKLEDEEAESEETATSRLTSAKEEEEEEETEEEDKSESEIKTEENDKVKFQGPYVVDLLTNSVSPSLGEVDLIEGIYKEIVLKLHKIKGDEEDDQAQALVTTDDPLYGNSIYLEGTYTGTIASGAVTDLPFQMSFELDEEFKLGGLGTGAGGFNIEADTESSVMIAFRVAKWLNFSNQETNSDGFDFTDLTSTTLTGGGTGIILNHDTSGNNSKIREVIKENIKKSADYGKDEDGDGKLAAAEDDDDDTLDEEDEE